MHRLSLYCGCNPPEEAISILAETRKTKAARLEDVKNNRAVPAYTTQAGWLGFSDERMTELMRDMSSEGFDKFKLKVGGGIEDDRQTTLEDCTGCHWLRYGAHGGCKSGLERSRGN